MAWAPLLPAGLQGLPSPAAPSPPIPSPSPGDGVSPQSKALAEALVEVVRLRYGSHLSGDELAAVQKALEERVSSVDPIRKLKLGNADEPVTVFRAEVPSAPTEKAGERK